MEQNVFFLRSRDYFISAINTISVEKREHQAVFACHYHDFDELVIVSAGNGLHIWNDIPYPITCGDIFYINPEDRHSYQSVNNLRLDNVLYRRQDMAILSAIEQYLPPRHAPQLERYWQVNTACLNQLSSLINELAVESKKPDKISVHLSEALFLQLAIILYRFRRHPEQLSPTPIHQMDMLLTALHGSISSSFSLDSFCLQLQISPRSLRRTFKAKTGMTIVNYLQQLRLCRAMSLLRDPTRSIRMIASDCGYDDSNYFSSVFHKEIGVSPSEYRGRFISVKPKRLSSKVVI